MAEHRQHDVRLAVLERDLGGLARRERHVEPSRRGLRPRDIEQARRGIDAGHLSPALGGQQGRVAGPQPTSTRRSPATGAAASTTIRAAGSSRVAVSS
jgi:hypothetical protein